MGESLASVRSFFPRPVVVEEEHREVLVVSVDGLHPPVHVELITRSRTDFLPIKKGENEMCSRRSIYVKDKSKEWERRTYGQTINNTYICTNATATTDLVEFKWRLG